MPPPASTPSGCATTRSTPGPAVPATGSASSPSSTFRRRPRSAMPWSRGKGTCRSLSARRARRWRSRPAGSARAATTATRSAPPDGSRRTSRCGTARCRRMCRWAPARRSGPTVRRSAAGSAKCSAMASRSSATCRGNPAACARSPRFSASCARPITAAGSRCAPRSTRTISPTPISVCRRTPTTPTAIRCRRCSSSPAWKIPSMAATRSWWTGSRLRRG